MEIECKLKNPLVKMNERTKETELKSTSFSQSELLLFVPLSVICLFHVYFSMLLAMNGSSINQKTIKLKEKTADETKSGKRINVNNMACRRVLLFLFHTIQLRERERERLKLGARSNFIVAGRCLLYSAIKNGMTSN